MRRILLASVLLLSAITSSAGVVIYDNMANPPNTGPYSNVPSGQVMADDFMLSPAKDIWDIHWTGGYFQTQPSDDEFYITICPDALGGIPSNIGCVSLSLGPVSRILHTPPISIDGGISQLYDYSVKLTSPFSPGTGLWWISIVNSVGAWQWGAVLNSGNAWDGELGPAGTDWSRTSLAMDFQLTGIPEPGTLAMLGLALIVLAWTQKGSARRELK